MMVIEGVFITTKDTGKSFRNKKRLFSILGQADVPTTYTTEESRRVQDAIRSQRGNTITYVKCSSTALVEALKGYRCNGNFVLRAII